MFKLLMVICGAFSFAAATSPQTAPEMAHKYAHHEVYEVQPGVQMAAKFAPDGLVCQMQLEQEHFGRDGGVDLRNGIDTKHLNGLIDELVPQSERGEEDKADPSNGMVMGTGQVSESVRSYSNVRVYVLTSHGAIVAYIRWRHRTCEGGDSGDSAGRKTKTSYRSAVETSLALRFRGSIACDWQKGRLSISPPSLKRWLA